MSKQKTTDELLVDQVSEIRQSNKETRQQLEDYVNNAKTKGDDVLEIEPFEDAKKFRIALTSLSEEVGHAAFVVLEEEKKRMGVKEEKTTENKSQPQPQQIPLQLYTAPIQEPAGFFGYLGRRVQATSLKDMQKKMLEMQERLATPRITTEDRVIDILDFGRNLIPEVINRTLDWFRSALAQHRLYPDEDTKRYLEEDLATHLAKLVGIIRGFCRVVVEYRKKDLDNIDMELAKGLTQIAVAKMVGQGQMSTSEIYRMLRGERGPTEF